MRLNVFGRERVNNVSRFQNLEVGFFRGVGKYNFPEVEPVYDLPEVDRHIEFDYCKRIREGHKKLGVHFFEPDYKFERVWTNPDRYGTMLDKFGYVIGPDFSVYNDFPLPIKLFNYYRNNWLVKYWQVCYNMIIVPTVMWGEQDTWDWCFDGLPKNSIVAVSNVGTQRTKDEREYFYNGYIEMLNRLNPQKVLFFTRNFAELPGNIEYIRWEGRKGDQKNG